MSISGISSPASTEVIEPAPPPVTGLPPGPTDSDPPPILDHDLDPGLDGGDDGYSYTYIPFPTGMDSVLSFGTETIVNDWARMSLITPPSKSNKARESAKNKLMAFLKNPKATELHLHNLKIGNLPERLFMDPAFKRLQHLDLSNTGATKLPESIGNLKELRSLSIGQNPIESLPRSMVALDKLVHLDMDLMATKVASDIASLHVMEDAVQSSALLNSGSDASSVVDVEMTKHTRDELNDKQIAAIPAKAESVKVAITSPSGIEEADSRNATEKLHDPKELRQKDLKNLRPAVSERQQMQHTDQAQQRVRAPVNNVALLLQMQMQQNQQIRLRANHADVVPHARQPQQPQPQRSQPSLPVPEQRLPRPAESRKTVLPPATPPKKQFQPPQLPKAAPNAQTGNLPLNRMPAKPVPPQAQQMAADHKPADTKHTDTAAHQPDRTAQAHGDMANVKPSQPVPPVPSGTVLPEIQTAQARETIQQTSMTEAVSKPDANRSAAMAQSDMSPVAARTRATAIDMSASVQASQDQLAEELATDPVTHVSTAAKEQSASAAATSYGNAVTTSQSRNDRETDIDTDADDEQPDMEDISVGEFMARHPDTVEGNPV